MPHFIRSLRPVPPHVRDVARRRREGAEARVGERGVVRALDSVHLCVSLDRALAPRARRHGAADALARTRVVAVVEDVVTVTLAVHWPPVAVVRLAEEAAVGAGGGRGGQLWLAAERVSCGWRQRRSAVACRVGRGARR
eukprot:7376635-Prymnesium_polylepis.3